MSAHKRSQAARRITDAEIQIRRLSFSIQRYREELAKLISARKLQQARIARARAAIAKAKEVAP